jgi:hypothetical protein
VKNRLEVLPKAICGNFHEAAAKSHLFPMKAHVADQQDEEEHKDNTKENDPSPIL